MRKRTSHDTFRPKKEVKCAQCDGKLTEIAEYPDAGTDCDFYEGRCKQGHITTIIVDRQTDEVTAYIDEASDWGGQKG